MIHHARINRLFQAIVAVALITVSCAKDPVAVATFPEVKSLVAKDITFHSANIVAYLENFTGVSCTLKVATEPPLELPGAPNDEGMVEWTLNDLSPSTNYSIAIELNSDGKSIVSTPVTFETRVKSPPAGEWVQFNDATFEECCLEEFDANGDGYLSVQEALEITSISIREMDITSIAGIEHFTNLTSLYCDGNSITSLKEIQALPKLSILYAQNNLLTELDVSHNADTMEAVYCTPQKSGEISALIVHSEQVIHGITDIRSSSFIHPSTEIIKAVRFKDPIFERYCLEHFDLNSDGTLTNKEAEEVNAIYINGSGITSVDEIRYFTNLEILSANDNLLSGTLDLRTNKKLIALFVSGNSLTSINLSEAVGLESLDISGCEIQTAEFNSYLTIMTKLASLNCKDCGLEELDLSNQRLLSALDCSGNKLSVIDLRYCAEEMSSFCCTPQVGREVETLYVRIVQTVKGVTEVRSTGSVSPETELIPAVLFESQAFEEYCLNGFDTDGDGYLIPEETIGIREIYIQNQELGSLKGVECFPNLVILVCEKCGLSGELDLSRNTKLEVVGLSWNELTGLILGYHPELYLLSLLDNRVSSINLSGTPRLESLCLDYCPLGNALNDELKKVPLLYDLRCCRCGLTELDLTGLPYLCWLICRENMLTTLDLSHCAEVISGIDCRQYTTKEIETIYVRKGQTIVGLTNSLDEDRFSPTTKVVVVE